MVGPQNHGSNSVNTAKCVGKQWEASPAASLPWSWTPAMPLLLVHAFTSHSHAVKNQKEKDVTGSISTFLQKCQWLLGGHSKGVWKQTALPCAPKTHNIPEDSWNEKCKKGLKEILQIKNNDLQGVLTEKGKSWDLAGGISGEDSILPSKTYTALHSFWTP